MTEASTSDLDKAEEPASSHPSPLAERTFSLICFWERYTHLKMQLFGQSSLVDWLVLATFGLEGEVWRMVNFSGWNRLLSMEELVYHDVTLDVLSTF